MDRCSLSWKPPLGFKFTKRLFSITAISSVCQWVYFWYVTSVRKIKYDKRSGFGFYKGKGLGKALLIHLSVETHKKLRHRAFMKELSIQKTVRHIIEEAVKDELLS